jgi:hypothetical protein
MTVTVSVSVCLCCDCFFCCSDAALRDVESNMTRLREAEEAASSAAEHKREEVSRVLMCAGFFALQAASRAPGARGTSSMCWNMLVVLLHWAVL